MIPKNAIILCGGIGWRMRGAFPMPKALIPVGKQSILERQILALKKNGIQEKDIILAAGNGERFTAISDFCREKGWQVQVVFEEEKLKTGGAIKNAILQAKADFPILALNGDNLQDYDKALNLICKADQQNADALILGAYQDKADDFGLLVEQNNGTVSFQEKVPDSRGYINAGVYLLFKSCWQYMPDKIFSIEYDVFPKIKIRAVKYDSYWFGLDCPERVAQAEEFCRSNKV
ncbi:MAG: sugar phosphate nucleotidyltransferase [Patescibacteria group bacterium]|nr:sugar phosphate nucleotidyltransferase [Patescibacteria group bacterium]